MLHTTAALLVLSFSTAALGQQPPERATPNEPIEIVMLGDSITKGVRPGVNADQTFAALTEKGLRELGRNVKVTNVGIGGERTDQALQRLDRDVLSRRPRFVLIMYGTNDSYVDAGKQSSRLSLADYQRNLRQLIERVRNANATPVLMTEPRWGAKGKPNGLGEHPNQRLKQYMEACRRVATETNTPLVDHYAHWKAQEQAGQDLGKWTTDECHPNPQGHQEMARLILGVLEL
jgi:lysophospholipase L1-like esterase